MKFKTEKDISYFEEWTFNRKKCLLIKGLIDPDPAIFVIDLFNTPTKNCKKSFSAYYFLKVHLHHFSKIKSQEEVTKQLESRFFLLFLLNDRRIRMRTSD
jgi:hypothetical protein